MRVSKEHFFNELILRFAFYAVKNDALFGSNLTSKLFGVDYSTDIGPLLLEKYSFRKDKKQECEEYFSGTVYWNNFSHLYRYAYEGKVPDDDETFIFSLLQINIPNILGLLDTDSDEFSDHIFEVVNTAWARRSLDGGHGLSIKDVALLANIDERTVRNAVSAKELDSLKQDKKVNIDNKSASKWLSSRKGFIPTKSPKENISEIDDVESTIELRAYLVDIREKLGIDISKQRWISEEKGVHQSAILGLENGGVFGIPIDKSDVLADFYNIDREKFLMKIMEVCFNKELAIIKKNLLKA